MKLFLTPGACSLAPHIALIEANLPFDFEEVDLASKRTTGGADYSAVNAKGYVPALQLDNGEVLTEAAVVLQYVADLSPHSKLAPAAGSFERYRLQEWLNFISSELHQNFEPLFDTDASEELKHVAASKLSNRLDFVLKSLGGKNFLMGDAFTVADCYLFTVLNWTNFVKFDLSKWPMLRSYLERVAARPAVQATLKAEGFDNKTNN